MRTIFAVAGMPTVVLTGVVAHERQDPAFEGVLTTPKGNTFAWEATPRPTGYEIWITRHADGRPLGARVLYDSATWNLGLEVATAAQRVGG